MSTSYVPMTDGASDLPNIGLYLYGKPIISTPGLRGAPYPTTPVMVFSNFIAPGVEAVTGLKPYTGSDVFLVPLLSPYPSVINTLFPMILSDNLSLALT